MRTIIECLLVLLGMLVWLCKLEYVNKYVAACVQQKPLNIIPGIYIFLMKMNKKITTLKEILSFVLKYQYCVVNGIKGSLFGKKSTWLHNPYLASGFSFTWKSLHFLSWSSLTWKHQWCLWVYLLHVLLQQNDIF